MISGLGNDTHANFKNYAQKRIEKVTKAEVEALNMSFLAEIKVDDLLILIDDLKLEISSLVTDRINLNARLKSRTLSAEDKQSLTSMKDAKANEISAKRKELEQSTTRLDSAKRN